MSWGGCNRVAIPRAMGERAPAPPQRVQVCKGLSTQVNLGHGGSSAQKGHREGWWSSQLEPRARPAVRHPGQVSAGAGLWQRRGSGREGPAERGGKGAAAALRQTALVFGKMPGTRATGQRRSAQEHLHRTSAEQSAGGTQPGPSCTCRLCRSHSRQRGEVNSGKGHRSSLEGKEGEV